MDNLCLWFVVNIRSIATVFQIIFRLVLIIMVINILEWWISIWMCVLFCFCYHYHSFCDRIAKLNDIAFTNRCPIAMGTICMTWMNIVMIISIMRISTCWIGHSWYRLSMFHCRYCVSILYLFYLPFCHDQCI